MDIIGICGKLVEVCKLVESYVNFIPSKKFSVNFLR